MHGADTLVAEKSFFDSLKSIVLHLIKNAEPVLYRELVPLVQSHDEKVWRDLSNEDKIRQLNDVGTLLTKDGAIAGHFREYPHPWSRKKFGRVRRDHAAYVKALKEQA